MLIIVKVGDVWGKFGCFVRNLDLRHVDLTFNVGGVSESVECAIFSSLSLLGLVTQTSLVSSKPDIQISV